LGYFLIFDILKKPEGSEEIKKISLAIRKGASAFLVREWKSYGCDCCNICY